jgi:hypothetical protein
VQKLVGDTTMKICLTCPFYLPFQGGVELHVYGLSRYLASRGHEI